MSLQEQVEINLSQSKNFSIISNQTIAKNTLIIGNTLTKRNDYSIIEAIPDNIFSVRILDIENNVSSNTGDYILQLHLEKIRN